MRKFNAWQTVRQTITTTSEDGQTISEITHQGTIRGYTYYGLDPEQEEPDYYVVWDDSSLCRVEKSDSLTQVM